MILVAVFTVRRELLADFRAYEHAAAAIMVRYGGVIERTIVVDAGPPAGELREVHWVRFPSAAALAEYQADAGWLALAAERARVIVSTEVLRGEPGPDYSPPAGAP